MAKRQLAVVDERHWCDIPRRELRANAAKLNEALTDMCEEANEQEERAEALEKRVADLEKERERMKDLLRDQQEQLEALEFEQQPAPKGVRFA